MARVRMFRVLDPQYPPLLRELRSPPDPVYVRGELVGGPAVAVVGTRDATPQALQFARELAARLVSRGISVWSGGAIGIDAAAHRGALDRGGITVAVVPSGLDHDYPKAHRALYDEIVRKGGAVVSPFARSQRAMFHTFHQRNAVLAALTGATIVVQAPKKSGARSTARAARELGRPLFVVPSAPWEPRGEGNTIELAKGAALLDEMTLARAVGAIVAPPRRQTVHPVEERSKQGRSSGQRDRASALPPALPRSSSCETVFGAVRTTPRHVDDLCAITGLPAALVQEALLTLTLEAVLVEGPAGWFRRVTPCDR